MKERRSIEDILERYEDMYDDCDPSIKLKDIRAKAKTEILDYFVGLLPKECSCGLCKYYCKCQAVTEILARVEEERYEKDMSVYKKG